LGRLVEIHDGYDIDGVLGLPCSFGNLNYLIHILRLQISYSVYVPKIMKIGWQ